MKSRTFRSGFLLLNIHQMTIANLPESYDE